MFPYARYLLFLIILLCLNTLGCQRSGPPGLHEEPVSTSSDDSSGLDSGVRTKIEMH